MINESNYYDLKESSGLAPSLATQIAREIGRKVVSNSYLPGDTLEDESALEQRYQVSRSVIRDAIKILVGKGLLEVRRGIGTKVKQRNNWGMMDDDILAWHLSVAPDKNLILQLMEIRQVFEPKASRWAAERSTAKEIKEIGLALENMKSQKGTINEFIKADALFHQAILKASHNEYLIAMQGLTLSSLLNSIQLTNQDPRENDTSIPFHEKVYKAIAKQDGKKAEELMDKLLKNAHQRLKDCFKP